MERIIDEKLMKMSQRQTSMVGACLKNDRRKNTLVDPRINSKKKGDTSNLFASFSKLLLCREICWSDKYHVKSSFFIIDFSVKYVIYFGLIKTYATQSLPKPFCYFNITIDF